MYKYLAPTILSLSALIPMGMGVYFVFMRPPLLPEDAHYIEASLAEIQSAVPELASWLQKVFWVMGGYIFTTGLLTLYLTVTAFAKHTRGVFGVAATAGMTSVGWMAAVNFMIDSDFKWLLLGLAILWALALLFFWIIPKTSSLIA
jgi:hypothetical protein